MRSARTKRKADEMSRSAHNPVIRRKRARIAAATSETIGVVCQIVPPPSIEQHVTQAPDLGQNVQMAEETTSHLTHLLDSKGKNPPTRPHDRVTVDSSHLELQLGPLAFLSCCSLTDSLPRAVLPLQGAREVTSSRRVPPHAIPAPSAAAPRALNPSCPGHSSSVPGQRSSSLGWTGVSSGSRTQSTGQRSRKSPRRPSVQATPSPLLSPARRQLRRRPTRWRRRRSPPLRVPPEPPRAQGREPRRASPRSRRLCRPIPQGRVWGPASLLPQRPCLAEQP